MAIHPLLPGIEVAVCVNNEPLQEYDSDESPASTITTRDGHIVKTITKYIESVSDQEFGLKYTFNNSNGIELSALRYSLSIDGVPTKDLLFRELQKIMPLPKVNFVYGLKNITPNGDGLLTPFKFSSIKTTLDDDAYGRVQEDSAQISRIGEIVVEVFRATVKRRVRRGDHTMTRFSIDTSAKVHEKAMKGEAKHHGASLGDSRPAHVSAINWKSKLVDGPDAPILRFIFKYRSKDALKQLLIVERSPEPEEISDRESPSLDLAQLNDEQRRKVEMFIQDLAQNGSGSRNPRIKRERNDTRDARRDVKRVKNSKEIELIDLTDD